MKKIIICAMLLQCLLLGQHVCAQTSIEQPPWTAGYFHEEENSYIEMVSATGPTEEEARNKAAAIAIERRSLSTGRRVNVQVDNGNVVIKGEDNLTVKSRVIDEYVDHFGAGEYRVYLLMQTAKNPTYEFERVMVTKSYGFSARVFVPGMAQLYKGSNVKGGIIIAGEGLFVGGIITSEILRQSNLSKYNSTHNNTMRQHYLNNVRNSELVRNISIGGAAVVYVYNLIDGIVAKGKKHVVIDKKRLAVAPYSTFEGGGLAFTFKF